MSELARCRRVDDQVLELGEGARTLDHRVVLVDLLAGRLLQTVGGRALTTVLELPMPLGAVAPRRSGGWIAAAGHGVAVLDGGLHWLARFGDEQRMRVNDGGTDPAGRFWVGTMAYDAAAYPESGALYRVDSTGAVSTVLEGLTVPNGPVFDAVRKAMYLADSAVGVIYRFDVDPQTGTLSHRRVFAEVSMASPDGMAVDTEGRLWSAHWDGRRLVSFRADGTVEREVALPADRPTSLALPQDPGSPAVVTTAAWGLDPPGPYDGRVLLVALDAAAPACPRFAG